MFIQDPVPFHFYLCYSQHNVGSLNIETWFLQSQTLFLHRKITRGGKDNVSLFFFCHGRKHLWGRLFIYLIDDAQTISHWHHHQQKITLIILTKQYYLWLRRGRPGSHIWIKLFNLARKWWRMALSQVWDFQREREENGEERGGGRIILQYNKW